MRKKNQLPVKWMLVGIVILGGLIYGTHEASKNMSSAMASNTSSPKNFFEFLANIFGMGYHRTSSGTTMENNTNLGNEHAGQKQGINTVGVQHMGDSAIRGASAQEDSGTGSKNSTAENNIEINTGNTLESNSIDNPGLNAADDSKNNSEYNQGNSALDNSENELGNNVDNTENNAISNLDSNSQDNSGSLGTSGNNPADRSGGNTGDNSGDTSGNTGGDTRQSGLPVINPIPSDNTVSHSIAQQNQSNEALSALVAARQALVIPVQQQSQATKYQPINSQTIPAVNTDQPPADVQEKIKSHQLTFH